MRDTPISWASLCLARATGTCQRNQPSGGKKAVDLIDFVFTTDETG